ncbi:MAG: potassium channel family protein [Pseudomonadota bacterium]
MLANALALSPLAMGWVQRKPSTLRIASGLSISVIWIMTAHLLEAALWAVLFLWLDIFRTFETSMYFALVAYTTLGFGDVTLPDEWRILSGFVAANGFLVFGWSTAFQVEYLSRMQASMQPPTQKA